MPARHRRRAHPEAFQEPPGPHGEGLSGRLLRQRRRLLLLVLLLVLVAGLGWFFAIRRAGRVDELETEVARQEQVIDRGQALFAQISNDLAAAEPLAAMVNLLRRADLRELVVEPATEGGTAHGRAWIVPDGGETVLRVVGLPEPGEGRRLRLYAVHDGTRQALGTVSPARGIAMLRLDGSPGHAAPEGFALVEEPVPGTEGPSTDVARTAP